MKTASAGSGCRLFCLVMLAAILLSPAVARAQSPRELRQNATMKLARGNFLDAIPDLEQLIQYLGESKNPSVERSMEMVYYQLGICHLFIGQFDDAIKAFGVFLKKYPNSVQARKAAVYTADSMRYKGEMAKAIKAYTDALNRYRFNNDMLADIHGSIARCYLADDNWAKAVEPLLMTYRKATDAVRRNWAATLLTTAYLKDRKLDNIYQLVPFLLQPDSFASRSVAFNMAALEAGDEMFADEYYRDALWIHRLVYPYDLILVRGEAFLQHLREQAELLMRQPGDPRPLMRIQENIAEVEAELKAMEDIENYDIQLYYRLARGYMELMRYWEARELFLYLHDMADGDLPEEALFFAFRCSSNIVPLDRTFQLGEQYMQEYPDGEYFDMLTLAMGQLYAREHDWPSVIRHLTRTLEMRPNHVSGAECMFLIGYASFMEEKFDDAVSWLTKLNSRYPGNAVEAEATYWTGMAYLFNRQYEQGALEFDRVLEAFPTCMYVEDASFRRAVCAYGLNLLEESETRLGAFLEAHPQSKMAGEATMMRGDIAGALGNLQAAVKHYQAAMEYPDLNIEFYNHCAFQGGRIMVEEEHYDELRKHFQWYIDTKREGSNLPQAIYWVGIALWNQGEHDDSLRYYREAVEQFGRDPHAIGIDMILDEWVARVKRSAPEEAVKGWKDLRYSLSVANRDKNRTMALRFYRVLLYYPDLKPEDQKTITDGLLKEENIAAASPSVLQAMLDMAQQKEQHDFAVKVANHIIAAYTETDYALDARMILADYAITRARDEKDAKKAQAQYDEAIKHLDVVREVYAASSEAGQALMILGRLYREREDFEKADECYKSVLGVKEWRNFWPDALYGRGECAFALRRFDAAAAYYERIYLLYGHYTAWAAKAYLRRAESLQKSYQKEKAREVLTEMLANKDLAEYQETQTARELMQQLGGPGS